MRNASSVNPTQTAAMHQRIDRRAHRPDGLPPDIYPAMAHAIAPAQLQVQLEYESCNRVGKSQAT
ncbi:hypothetical protein WL05_26435 [Burkholderia ubonensis]|uniref:Uncharacterized protein n=1 Tax=Burkholderia ubonensis TaxID=101571 RepID=A0ABD4E088_9BURK|nr:hypothetical protein WJ41_03970 [Burkholderia ubonensis]KVM21318.1 hypothetical protein WJ51_05625 [Burkholderia ubonensis]KVM23699.1 hypothetical protein WJ52_02195 [Burkholderia ubonensis]KVM48053.1 hypothetical protein WJ56_20680 [Burkholderia ubonensis]KVM70284.1 hypothetical protein WJ60_10710 [Burkholderia ubonensis]